MNLIPVRICVALTLAGGVGAAPVQADPVDPQQVVASFTDTIWPAIAAYHNSQSQGGPGSVQLSRVIDAGDDLAWGALREAVGDLGRNGEYDKSTQTTHSSFGLTLGPVAVTAADSDAATLDVCYTYTHDWYVQIQNSQQAPGASRATFGLVNRNGTWLLRSIADDHPVEGCDGSAV